jgi:hypothetical protein
MVGSSPLLHHTTYVVQEPTPSPLRSRLRHPHTTPKPPAPPSPMVICDKTVGHKDECTVLMTLFLGTQQGDGWLPGCKGGWGKKTGYCDWNGITYM